MSKKRSNRRPQNQKPRNRELALAMQEKRKSNAAGIHGDRRTKRQRSRSEQRRIAIQEAS